MEGDGGELASLSTRERVAQGHSVVLPRRLVLDPYYTVTYWLGWDRRGAACFACPGVCEGYMLKGLLVFCLNPCITCL